MATAWRTAVATFSFIFMNILLNIFNSWALRRSSWPDFEFPVFYTMSHMIVTALAALLLLAYVTPAATGMPTPLTARLQGYLLAAFTNSAAAASRMLIRQG